MPAAAARRRQRPPPRTAVRRTVEGDVRPSFLLLCQCQNTESEQDCSSNRIRSTHVNVQVHQVHQQEEETTDREQGRESRFKVIHFTVLSIAYRMFKDHRPSERGATGTTAAGVTRGEWFDASAGWAYYPRRPEFMNINMPPSTTADAIASRRENGSPRKKTPPTAAIIGTLNCTVAEAPAVS